MAIIYLSEADAKTKWCPYARLEIKGENHITGSYSSAINRTTQEPYDVNEKVMGNPEIPTACKCIASDCAKWDPEEALGQLTGLGRCGA